MRRVKTSTAERIRLLKETPAFSELEDADLHDLAVATAVHAYDEAEAIFHNNDKADGFYAVVQGEVEVFRSAPSGREQTLHILGPGELCGEVPVFHGGRYPASARARAASRALFIPSDDFYALSLERPQILMEMLAMLSLRLRRFAGLICDLSLKDVAARLAGYLLELPVVSGRIKLDCPKNELASRLGTIPETLSRSLGRLRAAGAIEQKGEHLRIVSREKLQALAGGEQV